MTAPHLQFRRLHADVLTATGALLEAGTSDLPYGQCQDEFQQWANAAAAAYRLPRVAVTIDNGHAGHPATGGHGYIPSPGAGAAAICLPGRSVIDLLESFRRHMQHHRVPGLAAVGPDADAAAWALSLYYTVRPRQLALLAAEGRVPGLAAVGLAGGGDPTASLPIDDGMRRAIFAALRDYYGTDLDRDDRLSKLSRFAGRRIWTINELTRAEAGRILDTLSTSGRRVNARRPRLLQAAGLTTRDC